MINPKKTKKSRRYLRKNMTWWEVRIWSELQGKKMFGFKVRRQYGFDNYIIDFYCPKLKLAIELDGDVHYLKEKQFIDQKKDQRLTEAGIKVVRIMNTDLEEDYESTFVYLEDVFRLRAAEMNIAVNDNIG